jgi:hypothetical protein
MSNSGKERSFFDLATGDGTPKRAATVALVVGTLLTAINHGDIVLAGGSLPVLKNRPDLLRRHLGRRHGKADDAGPPLGALRPGLPLSAL